MILEMIPKICSEKEIQLSEIEFAILSFQVLQSCEKIKKVNSHFLLLPEYLQHEPLQG